jgi:endonuclease/exonuclease/phosphatase family metal-dependent hydrolase
MRLTSWNFLHGLPTPLTQITHQDLARTINALNTDILGLQEVDHLLGRSSGENQVAQIARLMGTTHWAFAPSVMGSPDEDWTAPAKSDVKIVTSAADGALGYGIGLVSKIPVVSWHRVELNVAPVGIFMKLPRDGKIKRIYVHDHPRSAIAAVLTNGWLVINTHLSFVPFFNYLQLLQVKRWARHLPVKDKAKIIIMGDLNLRWSVLVRGINWNSLATKRTFPSWSPKVQIDYILSQKVASEDVLQMEISASGISDHLPISVDVDQ